MSHSLGKELAKEREMNGFGDEMNHISHKTKKGMTNAFLSYEHSEPEQEL